MTAQNQMPERRGGSEAVGAEAFRFAPRGHVLAFWSIGALGVVALAGAFLDPGTAPPLGGSVWLAPAGLLLIAVAVAALRMARRRPIFLIVSPEGIDLPLTLTRPLGWNQIRRLNCSSRRMLWLQRFVMLHVELATGARPPYRRWVMPRIETWLARRFGLRIALHTLDAGAERVLASIERFRTVERMSS